MINKIDKALNAYALNEQIDEIKFDFEINPTLENANDQRLIDLHKKLIKSGKGTVKVDLFIRVERGGFIYISKTQKLVSGITSAKISLICVLEQRIGTLNSLNYAPITRGF